MQKISRHSRFAVRIVGLGLSASASFPGSLAAASPAPTAVPAPVADNAPGSAPALITEYRVLGAGKLTAREIGDAVYPFLGPARTVADVEKARTALEQVYREKGFQTVSVEIPQQPFRGGVIFLQVTENRVGRLRVKGARYFLPAEIKKGAPSVAEGTVPDFHAVTRDLVALNQWPDRRVTPELRPGRAPGTVDIDLNVQDTFPLHGSVELNNRYSANTTHLRLNGSLSYNNLWQAGHSLGASFQTAPGRPEDAKVFSGFYLARFASLPWLSLSLQGTRQDSNVSTLGGAAVAGRGSILGVRAQGTLPGRENFFHSLSLGWDYKHFDENVAFGAVESATPITYYPLNLAYVASWAAQNAVTELNASANFHFRGTGSSAQQFEAKRYGADGSYFYLRGDLSHTRETVAGFQLYGKVQGQAAGGPLLNSEQISGGGAGTVRGYLESAVLGDNGLFGTVELRSPSLLTAGKFHFQEWRLYTFFDAGFVTLNSPLPEQTSHFELASYGFGTRMRFLENFNGSLDAGFPLPGQSVPDAPDLLLSFRLWADF